MRLCSGICFRTKGPRAKVRLLSPLRVRKFPGHSTRLNQHPGVSLRSLFALCRRRPLLPLLIRRWEMALRHCPTARHSGRCSSLLRPLPFRVWISSLRSSVRSVVVVVAFPCLKVSQILLCPLFECLRTLLTPSALFSPCPQGGILPLSGFRPGSEVVRAHEPATGFRPENSPEN